MRVRAARSDDRAPPQRSLGRTRTAASVTQRPGMFDWPELPFTRARTLHRLVALTLGVAAVAVDLTVFRTPTLGGSWWRAAMGAGVLAAFVALGGGARSLGLRLRPLPDRRPWWRALRWLSLAAALMLTVAVVVAVSRGVPVLPPIQNVHGLWLFFVGGCVQAPVTEELLYRAALCAPLAVLLGPRTTLLVSGVVFGVLHELWGNFAWSHPISGAVLAWMYLRSGCLWLPVAFHAFFNLWVLAVYAGQLWLGVV